MDSPLRAIPLPDGHLDLLSGQVHRSTTTRLTPTEVAVLTVLWEHAPDAASEESLLKQAWGFRTTNTRAVSMAVSRIRAKIEADRRVPAVLQTVHGHGYRLVLPERPAGSGGGAMVPIGRSEEMLGVRSALSEARVVQVVGAGGIGKSTLVRAVVEPLASTSIWVQLSDPVGREGLVRRVSQALELGPGTTVAAVESAVSARKTLILDGAEMLDADALVWVGSVLEASTLTVLLTTREPRAIPGFSGVDRVHPSEKRVLVGPLDDDAALELVRRMRVEAGLPTGPVHVADLSRLGGHPLALVLAAPDLEGTRPPVSSEAALDDTLDDTMRRLDDPGRALLGVLGCFAAPPGIAIVGERTERPLAGLLRELHRLRMRGLVRMERGEIAIHAFVRDRVRTPELRREHATWLAAGHSDPARLQGLRHDLEQSLDVAEGEVLAEVAFRHLQMLHIYGPTDRLEDDVAAARARLDGGFASEVLGWAARVVVGEPGVAAPFLAWLEAATPCDPSWAARAWMYANRAALQARSVEQVRRSGAALRDIRGEVADPSLRAFVTLQAAHSLFGVATREVLEGLFREVEALRAHHPQHALIAAMSRMQAFGGSVAEVDAAAGALSGIGESAFGRVGWSVRWMDLARLYLRAGATNKGVALVDTHGPGLPGRASGLVLSSAVWVLDRPDVVERWLGWLPESLAAHGRIRWLLDPPEGAPPFEDEALCDILESWRSGRPIPEHGAWLHLGEALRLNPRG